VVSTYPVHAVLTTMHGEI